MASEGIFDMSVVEDVIQQQGKRLSEFDLASRKANEASLRRYEAAGWLRKMVGIVMCKDLPNQPSEDEFRWALRSGIILCNVLNKVQSGAVPKVIEAPLDSIIIPDGAALSAYQYFENVRNFLVAVGEMGIPTFEASDMEQGGKSSRVVNCVLALKSYCEWKEKGGLGTWKYGGNLKTSPCVKQFVWKNSEPFMNSFTKSLSSEKSLDSLYGEDFVNDLTEMASSNPLHILVRKLISDKRQEEIPIIVENMINKVTEEFERRLANQNEKMTKTTKDLEVSNINRSIPMRNGEIKKEDTKGSALVKQESDGEKASHDDEIKPQDMNQKMLVEQLHKYIQSLRHGLSTAREDVKLLQMKYQEEVNSLGKHLHTLAYAASGYQKVLDENRKLYNQVQDLKGSIRVYCRVRPFLPGKPSLSSTVANICDGKITLIIPSKNGKDGWKSFTFNQVFGPSATQEEVFSDMQPLIRSVLDGYNVCIFAYGQTGSGKTYTMSGPNVLTEETFGVNYRALNDLFLISEQRKNIVSYEVFVQMMEIYNEQVRDLLVTDGANKRLDIRNSSQNGINVPDANRVQVASTSDVISLMDLGFKNRAVSSTAMNDRSSRSHSCLTVHVQGRDLTSGSVLRGCMHLVDLAGSERVDKSEAVGDRLKEAKHINKSLSALGDVIAALAQKNGHVPYRNSKLTQLLQDSLGGQAKTLMFVHISPESEAIGETISTLKFAERVSTVELGAARANKDSADVKDLREQIANLKAAFAKKEEEDIQQSKLVRISSGSSASNFSSHSVGNMLNCRKPMEDVGNIEVKNNPKPKQRRLSLDPLDMSVATQPWQQSVEVNGAEAGSGNCVDKIMVNKQNGVSRDVMPLGQRWDGEDKSLSKMSSQKSISDSSKIYPEQPIHNMFVSKYDGLENGMSRNRCEVATTDESDDLEAATSDSFEADYLWQLNNAPQTTKPPNVMGSKLKTPSPKQTKSPEISRSLIPQPSSRRLSLSGVGSPLNKSGSKPVSADGKRKPGTKK